MDIFNATGRIVLRTQMPERRFVYIFGIVAFVGIASAFVGHLLFRSSILTSDRFSIFRDHGYPEFFQYALAGVASLSLLYVASTKQTFAYLVPAGIMAYLLLDDAFQIHEGAGAFWASDRPIVAPIRVGNEHIGEALFLSIAGISFLLILFIAYLRAEKHVRVDLIIFSTVLFFAGVFGIVFDALHAFTGIRLFGYAEDGGELVCVAILSIFAVDRAAATFAGTDKSSQI